MIITVKLDSNNYKLVLSYLKRVNAEIITEVGNKGYKMLDLDIYKDKILSRNEMREIRNNLHEYNSIRYTHENGKRMKINFSDWEKYISVFYNDNIDMKYKIVNGCIKCLGRSYSREVNEWLIF